MVTCPRCARQVDETTGANCPNCSTPLPVAVPQQGQPGQPQSPQSYAPQLSRSGGTRVSLTGEVIEDRPAAAPSYVGGGPSGRPPAVAAPGAVGLAKPRAAFGSTLTEAPAKSSSGSGTIIAILLGLLVLGGLGAGGWWFLMPHSNPKTVIQTFDTAVAAQDWKTVYTVVDMPAETKSKYPTADAFASAMTDQLTTARANPMAGPILDAFLNAYKTAQVGEPTITGDTATVPVTITVSFTLMGKTTDKASTQQVPLKKVNGIWKIDGLQGALSGAGVAGSQ